MGWLKVLKFLKPMMFQFKGQNKYTFGIVAQDLLELFDEETYNIVAKGEDGYYKVDYQQLIPMLIKCIQEQQERIELLEKKLEE